MLADHGVKVDRRRRLRTQVDGINSGEVPFVEPGLRDVRRRRRRQRQAHRARRDPVADAYIVAVPTPFTATTRRTSPTSRPLPRHRAAALRRRAGRAGVHFASRCDRADGRRDPGARPELRRSGTATSSYFAHCPERVLPGRSWSRWSRTTGSSAGSRRGRRAGPRSLRELLQGRAPAHGRARPPRWRSSPRTPSATSTSRSPTSSRSSPTSWASTCGSSSSSPITTRG